jgi:predicted metal-dependent hydrolase
VPLERRNVVLNFDSPVDPHWVNGRRFESLWLNAYAILIPDGERFIIRTCRKYDDRLSPSLGTQMRGLYYQEGQHAIQHRRALDIYRDQGYRIDGFAKATSFVCYRLLEPLFPKLFALSTAAAIEHINAFIAEHYLSVQPFLAHSDPQLTRMFAWHFAEEIEHKCVVYDALNEINQGRLLRFIGLFMALVNFVGLLYVGTFILAWQDRSVFRAAFWRDFYRFNISNRFVARLCRSSWAYLCVSFHPSEVSNTHLVSRGVDVYHALKEL